MGVVQGLTEFLPISSSGHLVAARALLGAGPAEDVGFEVAVHAGTLLAVIAYYYRKILGIFIDAWRGEGCGRAWLTWIIVGTIPAGIIGIIFKDDINVLFNDVTLVGIAWLFTALLLVIAERLARSKVSGDNVGIWRALLIGCAQAVALIPGVSRSGSTISTALLTGVKRRGAVDFAFILSIPAIGGAMILTLNDWLADRIVFGLPHLAGGIAAGLSGYVAIVILIKVVTRGKMSLFAIYCAVAGILALILG